MKGIFLKPQLRFPFSQYGVLGRWLESDYQKANNREQLFSLVHFWFNESEISANPIRAKVYEQTAMSLYSILTNKSYESTLKYD